MGKLPICSGREVCRILERHDFSEVRRWGSHIVMQRMLLDTYFHCLLARIVQVKYIRNDIEVGVGVERNYE